MRRLLLLSLTFLTALSASAAKFGSFLKDHEALQKKLSTLRYKITINERSLRNDSSNIRKLKKDLLKINKRHKKIYKTLVKKFKIEKDRLEVVKSQQKSMKLRITGDNLDGLNNAYNLAAANNEKLTKIVEDNKAKAYTQSTNSGAYGKVEMITGNCMPQAGSKTKSTCTASPFQSLVVIRSLKKVTDLEKHTHYIGSEDPILAIPTSDKGVYHLDLNPGVYSFFILDDYNKEYCNSYDGDNNACKVVIEDELYSELDFAIDRASY